MNAISFLTKSFSRRTRFGYPIVVRLTDFDQGVFRNSTMNTGQSSSFHFASSEYEKCFRDLPKPDVLFLKQSSIEFLDEFDKTSWYEDPVRGSVYHNQNVPFVLSFLIVIYSHYSSRL